MDLAEIEKREDAERQVLIELYNTMAKYYREKYEALLRTNEADYAWFLPYVA